MYEQRYVNRRLRNTLMSVLGGVTATGIAIFAIIAFLGRYVGTFTVSLDSSSVRLSLSRADSYEKPESYLRVDTLPKFREIAYADLPSDDILDNQETDYLYGAQYDIDGEQVRLRYFKYTFYVKNSGDVAADFDMAVKIVEATYDEDGRSLLDTLRVMVYINPAVEEEDYSLHQKHVYARIRTRVYETADGEEIWDEPISVREDQASDLRPFEGYAEQFASDEVVCQYHEEGFSKDQMRRVTLVTWLEGNDADSTRFDTMPEGVNIKLGIDINAYENQ